MDHAQDGKSDARTKIEQTCNQYRTGMDNTASLANGVLAPKSNAAPSALAMPLCRLDFMGLLFLP